MKLIMKLTSMLAIVALSTAIACAQGSRETRVIAHDKLELKESGIFVVSDTTVYPLEQSYVQFSSDGINFHRAYQVGDVYFRHSNDSKNTWTIFNLANLTDVLWTRDGDIIYNTNVGDVRTQGNINVLGHYFLDGDSLKVSDLSASDGFENYVLQVENGKPVWRPLVDGSGSYFAQNVGVGGVPVYNDTDGTTFNFKSVVSSDGSVNVTDDTANKRIDITSNHASKSVTAGVALIGGGQFDASGNVALQFHIPELSPVVYDPADQFAIYRSSDDTHYKTVLDLNTIVGEIVSDTSIKKEDSYIIVQRCDSTNLVGETVSTTIVYGALYNWHAATDARNIANTGWHLPSQAEFTTLVNYLGNDVTSGGKLKETGLIYWNTPNTGATNEALFNGRGTGYRESTTGIYKDIKAVTRYLSTYGGVNPFQAGSIRLVYNAATVDNNPDGIVEYISARGDGSSIRLIKDATTLTNGQAGTYTGNDGKVYRTICIGTQEWVADNLAETKYRNGDTIPIVTDNAAWAALTTGAMCFYGNDPANGFTQVTIPETGVVCYNDTIYTSQVLNIEQGDGISVDILNGGFKTSVDSTHYAQWNEAYDNSVTSVSFDGTTTKTLTLTQVDGGTLTATFTDLDQQTLAVSSSGSTRTITISNGNSVGFDVGSNIVTGDLKSATPALVVDNGDGRLIGGTATLTLSLSASDIVGCGTRDSTIVKYGALYNWYAATDTRKIASSDDWVVPTYDNITTLYSYVNPNGSLKLRESGDAYWSNTNGTNELLFNARGVGVRDTYTSSFDGEFVYTSWWTSTVAVLDVSSYYFQVEDWMSDFEHTVFKSDEPTDGLAIRLLKTSTSLTHGQSGTYTGNDGKVYRTICIGTQEFLADNLVETKYRNGDWIAGYDGGVYTPISDVAWAALTTGAMCFYNDIESNGYEYLAVPATICETIALGDDGSKITSLAFSTATLTTTQGDGTTASVAVPTFNQNTTGQAGSVANSHVLKFDTGVTEGTDLYTYNGSATKTIDIKAGANITLTKAAGSITIASTATGGTSTATGEIWTALTGSYASATTFTFAGTDKDVGLLEMSLFTCTDATGSTRRIGYVKTSTNASGTITANVITNTDLASGDKDFKVAYNRKATDYMRLVTIPGEQIADASFSQGMFYSDIQTNSYLLPVDFSVRTAAAGAGAALTINVYKNTTNLFSAAPDMTTNTVLRSQRPTTNTISAAEVVSLRIMSSAGATNKAADFQAKLYIVPQSLFVAFGMNDIMIVVLVLIFLGGLLYSKHAPKKILIIFILLCSLQGFGQIKGYWRLDGNANDASGAGLTLTPTNITYVSSGGMLNQAASLNGTTSRLTRSSVNMGFHGTSEITISLILTTADASGRIIQKELGDAGGYSSFMMIVNGSKLYCSVQNLTLGSFPSWVTIADINDNNPHLCTFSWKKNAFNATDGKVYIDGREVATTFTANGYNSSFVMAENTNNLQFGVRPSSISDYLNGIIDEVKVDKKAWAPALSKNEYSRIKGFF